MLKKILIGLAVVFVLLIAALVSIPYLFKDQINAAIKAQIDKSVNAKVDYADYDLSLIRSFPDLSFGLNNLSIVGIDDFKGDTLMYIKSFRFSINLMSVINKETYKINEITLSGPTINATVNKKGKANWDIMKPSTDTTSSSSSGGTKFAMQIKKYLIENANIVYDDQKGGTYLSIGDLDFSGTGDVTQDNYKLNTKTSIAALTFKSGAVSYLSKVKIEAKNDIDVDQKNSKYSFKNNEIDLNDLGLLFDGFVQTGKQMAMDVTFKSKQAEFKSILSLIPAIYKKDFSQLKTSGSLALDGAVKGTYDSLSLPAIKLDLKVANAMFQYPSLPTAVTNINIATTINKPQGSMDLAIIDVSKLHAEIGTDPIDAVIHVSTPVSDPNVNAKIDGKVDLATVPKLYPMEGLEQLTGLLIAKLDFKGRMSDVDKKNYQAIQADGNIKVSNMVYDSKSTPMPIKVSDMGLTFSPKNVTLSSLNAVLGKSDISATGTIDNFMGYLFSKGSLTGVLNLKSNNFDANEWLTADNSTASGSKPAATPATPAAGSTAPQQYFQVPKGIDFTANSQFGKITYAKIALTNVKGNIHVYDEAIHLDNLAANLLGGSANISALYSTKTSKTPKVTFSYDIKTFDMQQTANLVDMAQKMAPVLKYLQGSYSSNLIGSGSLKSDMSVDYNSLQGSGKVSIPSAKVVGLPILQKIAEVTKVKQLENLAITNAFTVLKFNNGRVNVEPTDIKLGNGYSMNIQGSNGFDESIDYNVTMTLPTKDLGAATDLLNKIPKIPGVNIKMPETINVGLKLGGTVTKPTVGIGKVGGIGPSAGDVLKSTVDQAKQKAEEEAKKVLKDGADKAAKEAADQLKNATKGFKLPF